MNDPQEPLDPVARLLREAGRRTGPSPEAFDRIRAQVHAEWRSGLAHRRRVRWMAMAASVVVLVAGGLWTFALRDVSGPASMPVRVAHVVQGASSLTVERAPRPTGATSPADEIAVGDRLVSAAGAALALDGRGVAASLRLSPGASARWRSADEIELLAGSAYLSVAHDATSRAADPLVIEAGGVRIAHLGTQYLATLRPDGAVVVAVRDGRVRVERGPDGVTLDRGEQVRLRAGSAPERGGIDVDDERWAWVDALAPAVQIAGRSLLVVLQELAAEGGYELAFADAAVEREAATATLEGPELKLPPDRAVQRVLSTTLLRAEVDGAAGRITVRQR